MTTDNSNMLKVLEDFPIQCRQALELAEGIAVSKVDKVIVAGMGGSALCGDLLIKYTSAIPIFVVRDYKLPDFADMHTLVFVVSYSGNTEEALSCYDDAKEKNCQIITVTSGGQLQKKSKRAIKVPAEMQPRCAIGYMFLPVLGVLKNSEIIDVKGTEIREMLDVLSKVEDFKVVGKRIADKIKQRTPIVYSSNALSPISYRWKTQFNENAKILAMQNVIPEMNHNEIAGYQNIFKDDHIVIFIRDAFDHPRIKSRFDVLKEILESRRMGVEEIFTKGEGKLARFMSGIYIGDFVSYYLAISNRTDPTPVNVIENFKKKLKES